jgi:hypothetical protein
MTDFFQNSLQKQTLDNFVSKAKEIHGDEYDYSKVVVSKDFLLTSIIIICKIHGEFEQLVKNHIDKKKGCKRCALSKSLVNNNANFLKKATKIHGNLYDYSKVTYKVYNEFVTIICKIHGEFEQKPYLHFQGQGCRKCAFERQVKRNTNDNEHFIIRSRKAHGDLYDYSKADYKKWNIKVKIICKIHGEFEQRPNDHMNGKKCPKCINNGRSSIGEKEVFEFLREKFTFLSINRSEIFFIKGKKYEIDIFIKNLKIGIEYNGTYHHADPRKYDGENLILGRKATEVWEKDKTKIKAFCGIGIKVITLWELDWINRNEESKVLLLNQIVKSIKSFDNKDNNLRLALENKFNNSNG